MVAPEALAETKPLAAVLMAEARSDATLAVVEPSFRWDSSHQSWLVLSSGQRTLDEFAGDGIPCEALVSASDWFSTDWDCSVSIHRLHCCGLGVFHRLFERSKSLQRESQGCEGCIVHYPIAGRSR